MLKNMETTAVLQQLGVYDFALSSDIYTMFFTWINM